LPDRYGLVSCCGRVVDLTGLNDYGPFYELMASYDRTPLEEVKDTNPAQSVVAAERTGRAGPRPQQGSRELFDRTDDDWEAIVNETIAILQDQAHLRRVTSYSDLNSSLARRGHRPFGFAVQSGRAAMGAVLGEVVNRTFGDTGVMLSSIVAYIDRNDAGPGFCNLAIQLGLLANTATADDKLVFWSGQVARVHELYRRPSRERRTRS
jgi:hypothetical protein